MGQVFSVKEAAIKLGVHVNSIRNWIKTGRLKADQLTKASGAEHRGRHEYRIKEEAIEEFLRT